MMPNPQQALLTFRLGSQFYALPISAVLEVAAMVEVITLAGAAPEFLGIFNRHGEPLPMLDLRIAFGLPAAPPTLTTLFIVVQVNEQPFGLLVDDVLQVAYGVVQSSTLPGYLMGTVSQPDHLLQVIALPALIAAFLPVQ
ncbi:MAG: chemotaxis protein CheW [Armatimonadetes bacterium]|nr:chemotaxis protein CheW [Anaerolineae bacterium]